MSAEKILKKASIRKRDCDDDDNWSKSSFNSILLNRVVIWTQKIFWMFDTSLSIFRRRYTLLEMLLCSRLTLRNIQKTRRKRLEWLETWSWSKIIESVIWSLWWWLSELFVIILLSKSFERTCDRRVKTDSIQMPERRLSHSVESWKSREMFTHRVKKIMISKKKNFWARKNDLFTNDRMWMIRRWLW